MNFRSACGILAAIAVAVLCGGCNGGLPHVEPQRFEGRLRPVPPGAAPVLSWSAEAEGLYTYYCRQDVAVDVRAWLPEDATRPSDGCWEVRAVNGERTPLPCLGITERRVDPATGTETAVLVPEIDVDAVPDGLYIFLEPELGFDDGKLTSVRLVAAVREIRDHIFKPFRYPIPMIPDAPSALTPMPPAEPAHRPGTALPY
jgi:hypothetical protein